jgi:DNA-binding response OmpR family regulator
VGTLQDCKLLFVDDEEQFLATITKFLRRRNLDVATAHSGRDGLDWFAANPVDIVVLDIRMPGLNGVEVLREMRRLKGDDFGVIILSGHAHTDIALDAMRGGANDFLLKPCSVDELLERIDMLYDRLLALRYANEQGGKK